MVILAVVTTNQTLAEVKYHTLAALQSGVTPEEIKEAIYHCALYIGLAKAEAAVEVVNASLMARGVQFLLASGQTVTEGSRLVDGIAAQKSIFGDSIDTMRAAAAENQKTFRIISLPIALEASIPERV